MKAPTLVTAVLALLLWGAVSNSWAAYDAFLKFGDIGGGATDAHHAGWIEISSFQWGVGRGISSPAGGSADRESSAPRVGEIVVTKPTDSSSSKLFQMREGSNPGGVRAIIVVCRPGATSDFLSLTLYNTKIAAHSISSGGDRPTESLSLNFTKIEWTYTPQHPVNASAILTHAAWVPAVNRVLLLPAVRSQGPASRAVMGDGSVRTFAQVWQQIQMDLR